MAPKNRSRFVDNPPPASPSRSLSEDHEEESESSGEEVEEEHVQTPQKTLKKTQHQQNPKSPSSSEESDDGSKSSPTVSDFTIKPISSHTTKNTTKNQQQINSKEPTKPTSKRALQLLKDDEKKGSSKKKSKLSVENGEGTKRVAVNSSGDGIMVRIWSEGDEIAILKGMINYQSQEGVDPQADMTAFYEFIKEKFQFDVTKTQLYEKIRRLKKKFLNNVKKGENGQEPVFSKPHDFSSFELSKKIWGKLIANTNEVAKSGNTNGVAKNGKVKSSEGKIKQNGKKKREVEDVEEEVEEDDEQMIVEKEVVKDDVVADHEVDFSSKYPYLSESYDVRDLHMSETLRKFKKENISLIDHEKARELDEKWKRLRIQEIELFSKRSKLMIEQAKLVMDAMKKR